MPSDHTNALSPPYLCKYALDVDIAHFIISHDLLPVFAIRVAATASGGTPHDFLDQTAVLIQTFLGERKSGVHLGVQGWWWGVVWTKAHPPGVQASQWVGFTLPVSVFWREGCRSREGRGS